MASMELYAGAISDERIRRYLPVERVLAAEQADGADGLVHRQTIQINLWDKVNRPVTLAPGGYILVDFGLELPGGIRIISRTPGQVRLRFGESVSEAMGQPNQDHAMHDTVLALPKNGMLEYGNTAFRFVRLDNVDQNPLVLDNLLAVALYHDLSWDGHFECSDELLNRVWKTGAYTVLLNMQDFIYDGPKRDRLVWMGDLNPEIRTILNVFSDTFLIRKSMDFMREGTPLPDYMNSMDTYSLWYLINAWEYYFYTGDETFLAANREYIRCLAEHFQQLIDPATGAEQLNGVRFIDWQTRGSGNLPGVHAAIQGLLLWALEDAKKILVHLGEDVASLAASCARLRTHRPDPSGSKPAAALLTLSGLQDHSGALQQDLCRGVGTFYGAYILEALPTAPALQLIRSNWGAMLDRGATTFWEDFDPDWLDGSGRIDELPKPGQKDLHADYGKFCYQGLRHSLCHGWASGPTSFLSQRLLGVKFLAPGGSRLEVRPVLGDLDYVSGRIPTPAGVVSVLADRSGKLEVSAPAGVEVV